MKINISLALTILLFCFSSTIKAQGMGDLYKYLIEDYYNDLQKNGYLSNQDTLYFTCGFCDCSKNCFDYDLDLQNEKIQFKFPPVDKNHTYNSLQRLSIPELEGKSISISIGLYSVAYRGEEEDIDFIYSGTITYIFQYNKKKLKYELKEKKEYGL
jgi:hypothetical protein